MSEDKKVYEPDENTEFLVLKVSNQWPSKVTDGFCITVILKDMKTGEHWTVWPDSTWKFQFGQWTAVAKPGHVVKGARVFEAPKNRLDSKIVPQFVKKLDWKEFELHKPQAPPKKKGDGPLPGQVPLV